METLRKGLEINFRNTIKTKLVMLFMAAMLASLAGQAQDTAIRFVREKDGDGTPRLRRVEFWDIQKKAQMRTLDIVNENPFNNMGWKRQGGSYDSRLYDLSGKKNSDFLSKQLLDGYYKEMRFPDAALYGGSTGFYISSDNPSFVAIDYWAYLNAIDGTVGHLSALVLYDKTGNELVNLNNYDRVAEEMLITADGRILIHNYYGEVVGGDLHTQGYRLLDFEKHKYFDLVTGTGDKQLMLQDQIVYLKQTRLVTKETYKVDIYRIDLVNNKYYSQSFDFNSEQKRIEAFGASDFITTIEKYYIADKKPEQAFVWKDFESWWKK